MTISSIINRVDYLGNGVTTAFAFGYKFFQAADLVVLDVVIATGVTTTKTITTDYTISGVQDATGAYPSGGTITMLVAPASGHRLTIYRDPVKTQLVSHVDNDDVPAASIDNPLDLLTTITQRLAELVARSISQPDSDPTGLTIQLPNYVDRASMYLAFDASGNVVASAGTGSATPISSAMTPVVQATTLALARAAMAVAALGANADITSMTALTSINAGPIAGLRNYVTNGRHDFWRRGTNFVVSASGLTYAADRWSVYNPSGGAVTVSQQAFTLGQTLVPGEPLYFLRQAVTTGGLDPAVNHRFADVRTFAGQQITLSFWAKCAAGTVPLELIIDQNFGSGGSTQVSTAGTTKTVTTTFQKFTQTFTVPSVSGKTVGTNSFVQFEFRGPDSTTYTLDLSTVQIEIGAVASTFELRPRAVELLMCQRFFNKTFLETVTPAQNTGDVSGALLAMGAVTDQTIGVNWKLPVTMHAPPTVTLFSPNAASANWTVQAGKTPVGVVQTISENQVSIRGTTSVLAGGTHEIHAIADSEIY